MYRLPELRTLPALAGWGVVSRDLRGTVPGDVWYVLEAVSVVYKIDAGIRATLFDADKSINVGLMVCNLRPDAQGEVLPSEAGPVQFNLGSQSNFTPPAVGPHAIFAAREAHIEEVDLTAGGVAKYLRYRWVRSDVVSGLGNLNSEHTRIGLKFVGHVLREPARIETRDDAIRDEAYQRVGRGAWFNRDAALQREAARRGLGAVMTDEFPVTWGAEVWVAQGFAGGVLAWRGGEVIGVTWGEA